MLSFFCEHGIFLLRFWLTLTIPIDQSDPVTHEPSAVYTCAGILKVNSNSLHQRLSTMLPKVFNLFLSINLFLISNCESLNAFVTTTHCKFCLICNESWWRWNTSSQFSLLCLILLVYLYSRFKKLTFRYLYALVFENFYFSLHAKLFNLCSYWQQCMIMRLILKAVIHLFWGCVAHEQIYTLLFANSNA